MTDPVTSGFALGHGLVSAKPDANRCGRNEGEEVCGAFLIARCDAPEVLEFAEEALDGVTLLIENGAEAGFA